MIQTVIKIVATTLVALFIFCRGAGFGYFVRDAVLNDRPSDERQEDFSLYWEVWNRVEAQFYGDIPAEPVSTYGAIRGALATLEDPYTVFIEPEPAAPRHILTVHRSGYRLEADEVEMTDRRHLGGSEPDSV